MHMMFSKALGLASLAASAALTLSAREARACGCFAPPDPSVPILQAGERIVFAHEDNKVIAHIQIQYQGEAQDFGWLLPLPSIPTMTLGSEELFAQLINQTQPKYRLNRNTGESCTFGGFGRGNQVPTADQAGGNENSNPLVYEDSVGPYDFAVLRADSRQEMFDWLNNNRYFIPTGTEDVVGPYIRPGAYFLALKLRKGETSGSIQPVVLEYESDLPMIPIILTSVAANPDMGIQVWVLGEHRAIPRNFRHTVLNEEKIDWFNAGANYAEVVTRAVDEADGHHSFITEYAGTTSIMEGLLDAPGRFGSREALALITDAGQFTDHLRQNGFTFDGTLVGLLSAELPMPARLVEEGLTPAQFYANLSYYLSYDRQQRPDVYAGLEWDFDAAALATRLFERVVEPARGAARLFDRHSKMTRMYTTLSPEEMTKDPVFSYNPDLPDVSNVHEANLDYHCGLFQDGPTNTPATLSLPDGRQFYLRNQASWDGHVKGSPSPYSLRIELLRESGPPVIELDNSERVSRGDNAGCGCESTAADSASGLIGALLLLAGFALRRKLGA